MRAWFYGLALACAAALGSVPAVAAGTQVILGFDDQPLGSAGFAFDALGDPGFRNTIFGGIVTAATPGDPAVSGAQLFRGTAIGFTLSDPFNYCWPAVGAFVTGSGPITLTLKAYDADLGEEVEVFSTSVLGGVNVYLGAGSSLTPGLFTSALFTSATDFSMDDLTLGLEDVAPGVPEPASWVLLIGGFGMIGGAMRARRRGEPVPA